MTSVPSEKSAVKKKAASLSGPEQVAAFMAALQHPMKREIEQVREIILNTDTGITEQIKWNAPSFCFQGDDRITFNFQGKNFFRLIFHCGAKVKAIAPAQTLFEDKTGLLQWAANDRAILNFTSPEFCETNQANVAWLVKKWLETSCGSI